MPLLGQIAWAHAVELLPVDEVQNARTGGYHQTITRFYMMMTRHYTEDLLMSADARFGWVESDWRPIA